MLDTIVSKLKQAARTVISTARRHVWLVSAAILAAFFVL